MNSKQTSKKVASIASKKLKDKKSSESTKQQAWSALSQRSKEKETSEKVTKEASKILKTKTEPKVKKTLAWSNLSQAKWKKKNNFKT